MHDIDTVRLEAETETESFEVFGESENMELASELLDVSTEAELEDFLGSLVARAGKSLGQFVRSPEGKALVGVLKGAARQVLPTLGASVGRYVGGADGARLGSQLAGAAGQAFGLELEGLSNEDREFEVARRYVDFAGEAVRRLGQEAGAVKPGAQGMSLQAAMQAAVAAARTHAPGLAKLVGKLPPGQLAAHAQSGRWVQRGTNIILFGV